MPICDVCRETEATKEIHFLAANTKKYTLVCDDCFNPYKKVLIESPNLIYKGYYALSVKSQNTIAGFA